MNLFNEILELTKQLVAIPSINSSGGGEAKIAGFINEYFKSIPYYQAHPEQLITPPLKNDALGRFNVFFISVG